ncbi:hypothetical protein OC834_002240 [Tilletia horrida]|nr:hypothetical protein OC834_002240 [Tilletia horrida]
MQQQQQQQPAAYDRPPPEDSRSTDAHLTDVDVVAAFHSLLKDALAQARAEGLIIDEDLERAGVDVQVNGPALCLCFAALQAAGSPPAIRAPDGSFVLDNANCPPSFRVFFQSWQAEVLPIQRLPLESRHDLIRLICDKPPLHPAIIEQNPDIPRIAATLKSIAINLVQRRTFQLLFSDDLQHALDHNVRPRSPGPRSRTSGESTRSNESGRVHQYQPPPGYEPSPAAAAATPNPPSDAPFAPVRGPGPAPTLPPEKSTDRPLPPPPPSAVPTAAQPPPTPPRAPSPLQHGAAAAVPNTPPAPRHPAHTRTQSDSLRVPGLSPPSSTAALPSDDPNLNLIRETLLSALADVLATTPTIRALLARGSDWASHAYFACLCLAILDVALHRITPSGGVRCVQLGAGPSKIIGMGDCPHQLRRLLWALSNIGAKCQRLAEDDDLAAVRLVEEQDQAGGPVSAAAATRSATLQTNRIERLRYRLENGVDRDTSSAVSPPTREPGAGSVRLQTNVTEVSNNINQLALAFFKIPTFRERQREAFKVLQAVETL